MQIADIKHLRLDVALGGIEQRKIHMMGREFEKTLNHRFIAIHTPLITSLKGPGQKMSKSIPGSGISITDSLEEIKKTIKNAYCPAQEIKENPILQITQLIIFPLFGHIEIKRSEKFGGNASFKDYKELEFDYASGRIHPLDLKNAVIDYLWRIIEPIRKKWK
jgi:tyrosyl-tRNA synthetase